MSKTDQEVLETWMQSLESLFMTVSFSNMFLSILFAGVLQFLWGLINTVQMVMVTALFSILIPQNAFTLMITLLKLSNLDILRTEEIHRSLFGFTDKVPFNAVYEQAGYETTNFLIESGTLLFVIIAFALFTALKAVLKYATRNRGENCLTKRLR